MVGGVPVGLALRDLFYAAGLGCLLCVGYSAARMLLGSGKAVCFICDAVFMQASRAGIRWRDVCCVFWPAAPHWSLCFPASKRSFAGAWPGRS